MMPWVNWFGSGLMVGAAAFVTAASATDMSNGHAVLVAFLTAVAKMIGHMRQNPFRPQTPMEAANAPK